MHEGARRTEHVYGNGFAGAAVPFSPSIPKHSPWPTPIVSVLQVNGDLGRVAHIRRVHLRAENKLICFGMTDGSVWP